ncbi:MAG: 1-acyl-sn-glycerol-3-phosphate acyltransferase [Muribaculaceae bacterium]|nr:1-acyl-sn-glycerol-3-phosphate acyltransferase [Muribaculaceae bacterium]
MKFLYFIYHWLIAVPLFIVATAITAITTSIGSILFSVDFWGYWPPHFWAKFSCWVFFIHVRVKGSENIDKKTSYIFVANHQGAFDIFTIYGFLGHNFKWLMKKSLEKIFLVGAACRNAHHIFVDDTKIAAIKETITKAEDTLKDGMSLVIFPEGSRSWDGKMIPFKRGAFMLAAEFNRPVVPVTIDGSFQRFSRFATQVKPGIITLTIHKPILPGPKGFNTKQLMQQCREDIESSLREENKGVSEGQRVK